MFWFFTNLLLGETADAVVQFVANAAIYKNLLRAFATTGFLQTTT